jgi:copper resistance protein D
VVESPSISVKATASVVRSQILQTAWISLAIATISGVIWLQLEAMSMSGLSFGDATTWKVLSTLLRETQFGFVSAIRFALVVILAACLAFDRVAPLRWLALCSSLGLTAAIAWTGHAGATPGEMGILHLIADVLHLLAAAAWVGGVFPLTLLLASARRDPTIEWVSLTRDSVLRFSASGIIAVGTLLATGTVNTWMLVGSAPALLLTEYGELLTLKLIVFGSMLTLAAVNRFCLTPRLSSEIDDKAHLEALRQLTRNSATEFAFGCAIFVIVGLLGIMNPPIDLLK